MPIALRPARIEDAPAIARIYGPIVEHTTISFELAPPTAAELAQRIGDTLRHTPWLVALVDGAVAGYAYAARHRERAAYQWSADASVYVDRSAHRRGVGRALYRALFAVLRAQGFCAVHAGVTLPNPASVALHESLGFQPVGVYRRVGFKHGAWCDVGWWQLELQPRVEAPPPLRPFPALGLEELTPLLAVAP